MERTEWISCRKIRLSQGTRNSLLGNFNGPHIRFGLYHHDGIRPFIIYYDAYRRGFSRKDVSAYGELGH